MTTKLPTYMDPDFGGAIVPLEYTKAVAALKRCQSIDDAKQWAGKAEALAAWAKIYKQDQAGKEARRLKLHAHRKMGELAEALRPTDVKPKPGKGRRPGAASLLQEDGLSQKYARHSLALSRATDEEFDQVVQEARGMAVSAERFKGRGAGGGRPCGTEAYRWLTGLEAGPRLVTALSQLRTRDPREVAQAMESGEWARARSRCAARRVRTPRR